MKSAPSSPEKGLSRGANGKSLLDLFRTPRGRIAAAISAALAGPSVVGCGGEEKPEPPAICDTAERQTVTAPQLTDVRADAIVDRRLRVHFNVPDFDEECKVPLTVRVLATVWRGDGDAVAYGQAAADPSASEEFLAPYADPEGGFEIWGPGATSMDSEVPAGARVVSFRLAVTDAQGRRLDTTPTLVE
ncbi:hypothetical protein HYW83_03780 [Candidatus Peregrinibacteria bacterium]|nr:hypothetical protein [Candidatus Peregrinibacteria bacterium]